MESAASKIGRVTPAAVVSELDTSIWTDRQGLAFGPDGDVWFTETSANLIGQLTSGVLVVPAPRGPRHSELPVAVPEAVNPTMGPAFVGRIVNPSVGTDGLQNRPTVPPPAVDAASAPADGEAYCGALAQGADEWTYLWDDPFAPA